MNDKTGRIIFLGVILSLLCVVVSGFFGKSIGNDLAFLVQFKKVEPKLDSLNSSISKLPSVEGSLSELKKEIENSKYDSTKLTAEVSNEMSRLGMVVMDVSVKQTSGEEVLLSVKGVVSSAKLKEFMLGVSSVKKLFFVKKIDILPRNSAVQIISRFEQLQRNPKQLQSLKAGVNEAGLDNFNVEIEALVITS